ncbi:MAG: flavin reductase (DIM6/NTAB) family NADH-FMN oxidoreductase RutF [Flavobacteriales bacterium]|jgi:flavin reductase (DIM6/NTAB) family NADH-FMN oxidoreductase RutF
MQYTKEDIQAMDKIARLKIINSVTGIKPGNLIGTVSKEGVSNVAIFSSVVHLGSNPPLLGFISRPRTAEVGHTYTNIMETGCYTINHIHPSFIEKAHYTSAKFDAGVSEFERCGLTEEYIVGYPAPYVDESTFKMSLRFVQALEIPLNDTVLMIGEIEHLILPETVNGDIDLEQTQSVGISGLNSYYELKKVGHHPYVRTTDVPEF